MKESFVFYQEYQEIFAELTPEECKSLLMAIFEYQKDGSIPELDRTLKLLFIQIKQDLDRNNNKWEVTKQKRSEAGKKGMANRWNKNITNDNNVIEDITKITNITVNDNVNVNVNDNVNNNSSTSKYIDYYNNNMGTLIAPATAERLDDYYNDFKESEADDIICKAIDEAVEHNARTPKYIYATLDRWIKQGLKSLSEIKNDKLIFMEKKDKSPPKKLNFNYTQNDFSDVELNELYEN